MIHFGADSVAKAIDDAKRGDLRRFVYINASLDLDAETLVERSGLDWTIVRTGLVYGPGDEVISRLLKMVRTSPALPMIKNGDDAIQPLWHEDLHKALDAIVSRDDMIGKTLDVAGAEVTTLNDIVRRLCRITDRHPMHVPLPKSVAPETNVLPGRNDLVEILRIKPTPLDRGLLLLADAQPEVLPDEGVGAMKHKKYWADIAGSSKSAAALMTLFRERVTEVMPIDFAAEPGVPTRVEQGVTMTGALPMRGNVQVRAEIVEPTRVVFATVEGHAIAGIVELTSSDTADGVRFCVDVYARAANVVDWIALETIGRVAQTWNWRVVVQRMIDLSGGTSDGVHQIAERLSEEDAGKAEARARAIVEQRQREDNARRNADRAAQ